MAAPLTAFCSPSTPYQDNAPCKMKVYSENGQVRPLHAMLESPSGENTVYVRNTGQVEFPIAADVVADKVVDPSHDALSYRHPVQGGAIRTFHVEPSIDSVQVLLMSDGRPLNARIELLQGPDDVKQSIELYTEDGVHWPFFCFLQLPEHTGSVVRIVNTAPIEFPILASVVPHGVNGFVPMSARAKARSTVPPRHSHRAQGRPSSAGLNRPRPRQPQPARGRPFSATQSRVGSPFAPGNAEWRRTRRTAAMPPRRRDRAYAEQRRPPAGRRSSWPAPFSPIPPTTTTADAPWDLMGSPPVASAHERAETAKAREIAAEAALRMAKEEAEEAARAAREEEAAAQEREAESNRLRRQAAEARQRAEASAQAAAADAAMAFEAESAAAAAAYAPGARLGADSHPGNWRGAAVAMAEPKARPGRVGRRPSVERRTTHIAGSGNQVTAPSDAWWHAAEARQSQSEYFGA